MFNAGDRSHSKQLAGRLIGRAAARRFNRLIQYLNQYEVNSIAE